MTRLALVAAVAAACSSPPSPRRPGAAVAPLSLAADEHMVTVPAGPYVAGSTPEERATAYDDYEHTSGRDVARAQKWFDGEEDRHVAQLPAYRIDLMPVTQAQYAEFVIATGVPAPAIDEAAWKAQGFSEGAPGSGPSASYDYATQVARFVWRDGHPPVEREDHPVVLVTWAEADHYCKWRGEQRGEARRLPTAAEYEKAARGEHGFAYPWGNAFEAAKLNSAVGGPGDTTPAGTYVAGASEYGLLDMAGNVFSWTATPYPREGNMTVKGSAWDDFGGVGRGASGHGRAKTIRHVIVGFRCAADAK